MAASRQQASRCFVLGPVTEREVQHPAAYCLVTLVFLGTGRVTAALDERKVLAGIALCILAIETADLRAAAGQHPHHPARGSNGPCPIMVSSSLGRTGTATLPN